MRSRRMQLAAAVAAMALGGVVVATATAGGGHDDARTRLSGFEEVPAVSTDANGKFKARIRSSSEEIQYELSYSELSGDVQQAHIHLGQEGVNGNISVFLCSNLGNGPPGTQACPPGPATITGTITPESVIGPAQQGLEAGEFDELLRAIDAEVTYVNVHSASFPSGEIRGQLD